MDVKAIIREYLEDNGFDGLCGDQCGCKIDDLAPCDGCHSISECVPGYLVTETRNGKYWGWHISSKKPE